MPTEMSSILSEGTVYLKDKDGNVIPIKSLTETILPECVEGTSDFVGAMPLVRTMTFTMRFKGRHTRAKLRAAGLLPTRRRSKRAIGRPIRRIKRRKEKARRYTIKNGIDKKIIAHFKKYLEEHSDE